MYKQSMMVVVETRCNPVKLNKSLKLLDFNDFIIMENRVFSERIVAALNKNNMEVNYV